MSAKKKNFTDKLANKKKTVLNASPNKRKTLVTLAAVVILAAGGALAYLGLATPLAKAPPVAAGPGSSATPVDLSYPVDLFDDGRARHFEYHHGGLTVRYFILKSADGVLRAAFDACDVCWHAGKGYFQEGDRMVCRNCGRKFDSSQVNEVQGGCNPAPLNRTVVEDRVILQVSDILRGKSYFDFSKGRART
jgi:uncharacterized membrane protein